MSNNFDFVQKSNYIQHHLIHLNNTGKKQDFIAQFEIINYDSIFWSIITGLITILFFYFSKRIFEKNKCKNLQIFVEIILENVNKHSKYIIKNNNNINFISSLLFLIFFWIISMNILDLLPVDLLNWIFKINNLNSYPSNFLYYHRILPTADLNITMGMSISVLIITIYFGIKNKNLIRFLRDLTFHPFYSKSIFLSLLIPINLTLNLVEYSAKSISLGMRLFGNMFSGELIFMLIALLGGSYNTLNFSFSVLLGFIHVFVGSIWSIFHIFIIILQSFIFTMLTLIYIGNSHKN